MTFDVSQYLGSVERTVQSLTREGKRAKSVTLTRNYDTSADDLWDAVTNPERLPRWFLAVEGDLKEGGRFQLKGNAGGKIVECRPPQFLGLTWELGREMSWVDVTLTPVSGEVTRLEMTHTAIENEYWMEFGPGAGGVGWDLGLIGLAFHLEGPSAQFDENAFATSKEGVDVIAGCANSWADADIAAGADPESARSRAKKTASFYTGGALPDA